MLPGHVDFSKRITNIKNLNSYLKKEREREGMSENEFSNTYCLRQHKPGILTIYSKQSSLNEMLLPDSTTRNEI